jgi:ATP synthase protein I
MAGAGKESGRKDSGRDAESIRQRLDTLEGKLAAVRGRNPAPPDQDAQGRGQAMGQALRLGTELVAGVLVGGFIGWALDKLFGSAPLMLVVFLILGAAAGILNVVRTAQRMQAEAPSGKKLPSVPDDDDD